ncbi:hypothetical protein ACIA8H_33985 [Streptomyces goshikiensis]|uniref:hypothetical protein n=1 Tax=Streptomyces goshikiensis TaxID=1942 RepID=UPI00378CBC20
MSPVPEGAGIAAGVGRATDGGSGGHGFRAAAAWAWLWRSFDMALPDVGGGSWQTDPVALPPQDVPARGAAAEAEGYRRYLAHGPW